MSASDAYEQTEIDKRYRYFQGIPLYEVQDARDAIVYLYGRNYHTVLRLLIADKRDSHKLTALDLTAFENRKSSDFLETWQSIQWAVVEDNVLYVQHKGYGYQGYYDGKTAYITAISLEDYRILWTSSPRHQPWL